jgi:hypothetical protein
MGATLVIDVDAGNAYNKQSLWNHLGRAYLSSSGPERSSTFVVLSDKCAHGYAALEQQMGNSAPGCAHETPGCAGDEDPGSLCNLPFPTGQSERTVYQKTQRP